MAVEFWIGKEFEHTHEMRALRTVLSQMVDRMDIRRSERGDGLTIDVARRYAGHE